MPTKNDRSIWDQIWGDPTENPIESWRKYPGVYGRINWLLHPASSQTLSETDPLTVVDVGCGIGILLSTVREHLHEQFPHVRYVGYDHSEVALAKARKEFGWFQSQNVDFEQEGAFDQVSTGTVLTCTETLEHLTLDAVHRVLEYGTRFKFSFFSVPNWSLGPEDEPTHERKWSAVEFLNLLRQYYPHCRVECLGYQTKQAREKKFRGYLLGVCGYPKKTTLSVTLPVKNEEDDLERVLSSFRGVADQLVVGIDDTTIDNTEKIVNRYADDHFHFTWEKDFSKARNECIERCTGDWIFMTEGHESLRTGTHALLQLHEIPSYINVLEVKREAKENLWYFPWLFRNKSGFKFKNAVHNALVRYEDFEAAKAPQIHTWHERSKRAAINRVQQRRGMNKQELLRRIVEEKNFRDMYYLANEYKDLHCQTCKSKAVVPSPVEGQDPVPCPDCAFETPNPAITVSTGVQPIGIRQSIKWYERFIATTRPNNMGYQARLALSSIYTKLERWNDAKRILSGAIIDDATRVEHWILLGEISERHEDWDMACRYYEYASTAIGRPPVSYMFLDKSSYTYVPAQKLANAYAMCERWEEALTWANKVPELLPHWAPESAMEEAQRNIEELGTLINSTMVQPPPSPT